MTFVVFLFCLFFPRVLWGFFLSIVYYGSVSLFVVIFLSVSFFGGELIFFFLCLFPLSTFSFLCWGGGAKL